MFAQTNVINQQYTKGEIHFIKVNFEPLQGEAKLSVV